MHKVYDVTYKMSRVSHDSALFYEIDPVNYPGHYFTLDGQRLVKESVVTTGSLFEFTRKYDPYKGFHFSIVSKDGAIGTISSEKIRTFIKHYLNSIKQSEIIKPTTTEEGNSQMKTGQFIVGSIDKSTGVFSATSQPMAHLTKGAAKTEATRLAGIYKTKKYVVLEVGGIVSATDVVWE